MNALHFLRPECLWLLLLLPPLGWWLRRRAGRDSPWREVVDPHLLRHLLETRNGRPGTVGWLALPVLALAILALAGPSWTRAEQPLWQTRAPLVVAMDLSGAMDATDLAPSRLARARAKLDALLRLRRGGEVGLLVFARDAYVVAPLTDDAANVALFIDALSPGIMPVDPTDAGTSRAAPAIERAAALLRQADFDHGDILVISDHADDRAVAAATQASADGFRVSALGVGTDSGAAWRDPAGRIHRARLDAGSLRALARAGRGGYATLATDASDLAALGVLDPRDAGQAGGGEARTRAWQDQGYWLLLPLLVLALFAFRRGTALAAVLLCALLPLRPAHAGIQDWWLRDDQQTHARMEQGREAYRAGDFDRAASAWRELPGPDAAYNLGNALAKQGRYEEAVAAYDEALRRQPGMEDAIANRKAVLAAMQRKSRNGDQPGSGDGKDGDQGQSGQPNGDARGKGQDQGQARSGSDQRQPDDTGAAGQRGATPPPRPADAEAQGEADAAQRERMRQALQAAGKQEATDPGDTPAAETTAQREQRLANEAWLRRVPDDPGGLLRERFRLERLRRERGER